MPVSAELPNLDHVYAKWENRGPKGRNGPPPGGAERSREPMRVKPSQNGDAEQALQLGRRKWRDKFGDNVKPLERRRPRERNRMVALPAETVSYVRYLPVVNILK